jgi:hypothetical protein
MMHLAKFYLRTELFIQITKLIKLENFVAILLAFQAFFNYPVQVQFLYFF